jgi:hypothetical protein
VSPIAKAALSRIVVAGELPSAREYCERTIVADCTLPPRERRARSSDSQACETGVFAKQVGESLPLERETT